MKWSKKKKKKKDRNSCQFDIFLIRIIRLLFSKKRITTKYDGRVVSTKPGSGRSWTEPSDTPTIRIYSAPPPWYIIYWWSFTGTGASITLFIRTTGSEVRTGYSAIPRPRTWWNNICKATTGARWPSPLSVIFPGNFISFIDFSLLFLLLLLGVFIET